MSVVTIVWSVIAASALLLALMHLLIWSLDRKALANLSFAVFALSVVGIVISELLMMQAETIHEWGEYVRWAHVPVFSLIASLAIFIRLYLGTGRVWLLWTVVAMRAVVLLLNFSVEPNFNFSRIDSIVQIPFLGEGVTVLGEAVTGPWQWFGALSNILLVAYMADALVARWRTGTRAARRTAILIGSATMLSVAAAALNAQLMVWGVVKMPVLMAPPFLILLGAMAFEMSHDTLRASRLARELLESEARLEFAAAAADLGLWNWEARPNRIWATNRVHEMFGLKADDALDFEQLRQLVHPEDTPRVRELLLRAAAAGNVQEVQFRVCLPGGVTRCISARGRSEADAAGTLTSIQGVLRDVTEQFRARQENAELRRDLAHVERVSVLGRLSASVTHELSQPLGAILRNAEAAELLLQRPDPDLEELRQIVADIQRDDRRAGDVINGLRSLLKRRQLDFTEIPLAGLLQSVLSLLRADANARSVVLESRIDGDLIIVRGDRVHLSQVLINLIINAMDAVADLPAERRLVNVSVRKSEDGSIEFAIVDSGAGIANEALGKIFEPFFTTKSNGMGMGLSVSRTIIEAHQGRIWATNGATAGATFRFSLPAVG